VNLDKPTITVPFHSSYFRLYDSATITCRACSIPSPTIFDFFRPKQARPIDNGIKEKFDEIINQTCRQLTITLYVRKKKFFQSILLLFLLCVCD
jgi:hypothetical protein